MMPPEKIVSGGQTGVDRAALDIALELGFDCGGWCPRGRKAEDGPIDPIYPLTETESGAYIDRTRRNVRDSDGTLILAWGELTGGTRATAQHARSIGKPLFVAELAADECDAIRAWLADRPIAVLNVAGPRESTQAGTYDAAASLLRRVLEDRP